MHTTVEIANAVLTKMEALISGEVLFVSRERPYERTQGHRTWK